MGSNEELCLRWDDFSSNIRSTFRDLKEEKDFADVTLVCSDGQTDAHKVILSAGSSFFQKILKKNPHSKPLIYLKGIKFSELQLVLSFIYQGEATVAMSDVSSFLAVAEDLELKGLSKEYISNGNSDQFGQKLQPAHPSYLPQPLLNLQQPPTCSPPFNNNCEQSIKAEAPPIKAEEQSGHLEDFAETPQAEFYQECYDGELYQYEHSNQYQDAEMGNQERRGRGRPRTTAGPAPGIKWKDLEQHIVLLSGNAQSGQHQCLKCGGIFTRKELALNHMIARHFPAGTFEFNCDGCYEVFDTPQKLEKHRSKEKCFALPQE